jgi:hypothetical protein
MSIFAHGDGLRLFAALVFFAAVFGASLYTLHRTRDTAVRTPLFILLVVGWVVLAVAVMNVLHLLMGEVAAAWILALLLWGGIMLVKPHLL